MIDANETLGQLAIAYPAATPLLLRYQLDYCCGGTQTLQNACDAAGLDAATIIAEIEALGDDEVGATAGWATRPIPELVEHVLNRYHKPLHEDLPGLVAAAQKIERVHADKSSCPRGLAAHLAEVHAELEGHMGKEEQVLFPALLTGRRGQSVHMPIRVMMQEHDDHGVALRRVRELAADFALPVDACGTWRALYAGLEKLESDLMEHIHLENNILFPRALSD